MEQEEKRTLVWAIWNLSLTVEDKGEFEKRALKCIDDTLASESDDIHHVSGDLPSNEKDHYKCLLDCCNQLIDAVDVSTPPVRSIKGLRVLLNRPDNR